MRFEQAAGLFVSAAAAVGYLNINSPLKGSDVANHLHAIVDERAVACRRGGSTLRRELWNMAVAVDPLRLHGLHSFGRHVLSRLSTAEGREDLTTGGLAMAADVAACTDDDWARLEQAQRAVEYTDAATGDARRPALNPRAYCGVFSASDAAAAQLCAIDASSGAATHGTWDHPALHELRGLSAAAAHVLVFSMYMGYLTATKKHFEHLSATRLKLAPGESGGRYHCVAPERVLAPELPSLMDADAVRTLHRNRIVVCDDVLPSDILRLAQAEARAHATDGSMRGEVNSTCNPGEKSIEMALWDPARLEAMRARCPGLHHCVRSMWNLASLLGPALGLDVRVPQVVLLASYPKGV